VGAKASVFLLAALAAAGCSGGLKRFAPPGFVKYEDLAQGQPVAPSIAARIDASRSAEAGDFPDLSAQPSEAPAGIAAPERVALGDELEAARVALIEAVERDRAVASAERIESIEAHRDALDDALKTDDAAARKERGLPPAPPAIKD
jgi:hypothetical protein